MVATQRQDLKRVHKNEKQFRTRAGKLNLYQSLWVSANAKKINNKLCTVKYYTRSHWITIPVVWYQKSFFWQIPACVFADTLQMYKSHAGDQLLLFKQSGQISPWQWCDFNFITLWIIGSETIPNAELKTWDLTIHSMVLERWTWLPRNNNIFHCKYPARLLVYTNLCIKWVFFFPVMQ